MDVELFCEPCRRPFTAHGVTANDTEADCPSCGRGLRILQPGESSAEYPAPDLRKASPAFDLQGPGSALEKLAAAHDELSAMCQRQWAGKPAIRWSIPAQPGRDSDLIIGEALEAARAALQPKPAPARPPVLPLSPQDFADLDPGIRDIVERLREAGFETVDSGDGKSKPPESRDVPFPHVFAQVADRAVLLAEADRMAQLLGPAWAVEASYDTAQEAALLMARPADAYDRADGGQMLLVTPEELEERYSRGWADALRALAGALRKALAPESLRSLLDVLRGVLGAEAAAVLEQAPSEAPAQPNPKSEPIAQGEEAGRAAGASYSMPPPAAFAVRNAEIEPILRELGDRIGGRLPEGWGFALFLVSYGEEGELFYISSAEREGMATALRGWLARQVQ
jgi:hypothetical protein